MKGNLVTSLKHSLKPHYSMRERTSEPACVWQPGASTVEGALPGSRNDGHQRNCLPARDLVTAPTAQEHSGCSQHLD